MTLAEAPADVLTGLKVIDADAHFTEPPDLWSSRVPATLCDRVPQQRTVDGVTGWYLDGEPWASIGGNTLGRGRRKVLGSHVIQPFESVDPAAWDVEARLELLDAMGIWAQVIYPNGIGFASNHIFAIDDDAQRTLVLQTYNDFLVDLQRESGRRLLPQAILPIWDMALTVAEMTRLREAGITGFTLSDKPELLGLPELPDPYFDPMWDLADATGAVMNFHIGAGNRREDLEAMRAVSSGKPRQLLTSTSPASVAPAWSMFGQQRQLAIMATQIYMSNVRIIVNLTMSDLFDRYPNLRIVSAESGIGWVPFILESLEYQLDEMVTDPAERALAQRRPTEYFHDHFFVMFWYERVGPSKLLDDVGVENVLIETDVPHPTCLYPGAREHFADVMAAFDERTRRRVLQDNAAELYGIPV